MIDSEPKMSGQINPGRWLERLPNEPMVSPRPSSCSSGAKLKKDPLPYPLLTAASYFITGSDVRNPEQRTWKNLN